MLEGGAFSLMLAALRKVGTVCDVRAVIFEACWGRGGPRFPLMMLGRAWDGFILAVRGFAGLLGGREDSGVGRQECDACGGEEGVGGSGGGLVGWALGCGLTCERPGGPAGPSFCSGLSSSGSTSSSGSDSSSSGRTTFFLFLLFLHRVCSPPREATPSPRWCRWWSCLSHWYWASASRRL